MRLTLKFGISESVSTNPYRSRPAAETEAGTGSWKASVNGQRTSPEKVPELIGKVPELIGEVPELHRRLPWRSSKVLVEAARYVGYGILGAIDIAVIGAYCVRISTSSIEIIVARFKVDAVHDRRSAHGPQLHLRPFRLRHAGIRPGRRRLPLHHQLREQAVRPGPGAGRRSHPAARSEPRLEHLPARRFRLRRAALRGAGRPEIVPDAHRRPQHDRRLCGRRRCVR